MDRTDPTGHNDRFSNLKGICARSGGRRYAAPEAGMLMKFLFDLFPVILFFATFKLAGIYAATAIAIAATLAQVGWVWYRHRKVDTALWVGLAVIVIFGGATLILHNESFIKWKPTVLYWLFASAMLIAQTVFGKNLIRAMLEKKMSLPDPVWNKLSLSWIGFFALLGVANLYVAYSYSTEIWVNFKLFGSMGLMFAFVLLQGWMLSKYLDDKERG